MIYVVQRLLTPLYLRIETRLTGGRAVRGAVAAASAFLLSLLVFWWIRRLPDTSYLLDVFNPIHMEHFGTQDVRAQKWTYAVFLVSIATLAALAIHLSPARARWPGVAEALEHPGEAGARRSRLPALLGAAATGLLLFWFDSLASLRFNLLAGLPAALLLLLVLPRGLRRAPARWELALMAGAFAVASVPFAWTAPWLVSAAGPTALAFYEHHYVLIMTWGEQLGRGVPYANEVNIAYNYLWPLVLGGLQRAGVELPWSFYVVTLGAFSAAFAAGAIALVARVTRDSVTTWMGAMLILAWNHVGSEGYSYPNQGAFRYAGLLVLLWILWATRERRSWRAVLPAVGGCVLCYLWNPATGLAGMVATGAFLAAGRGERPIVRHLIGIAGLTVALGAAAMLVVSAVAAAISGSWHFPNPFPKGLALVSALGGLTFEWHSAAIVALLGAAAQVICSAQRFRRLDPAERFRLACAAACLVWGVYWVNRPYWMNLKGILLLFIFVAAEWIRYLRVALRRARTGRVEPPLAWFTLAMLAAGLAPTATFLAMRAVKRASAAYTVALRGDSQPSRELSGMHFRPETADYLQALAAEVRDKKAAAGSERVLFLTKHPYMMPRLVGPGVELPLGDPFFEAFTKVGLAKLVDHIRQSDANRLLVERIDERETGPLGRYRQHFAVVVGQLGKELALQERGPLVDVYVRRR